MKSILIVTSVVFALTFTEAEEMKVYPKGVSQVQVKKHGRARTKARIHQITRSGIFSGLTEGEKDNIRLKAMNVRKHNWSTTEKEKKHKKRVNIDVRCNGAVKNNKGRAALGAHKSRSSKNEDEPKCGKCKTKF